LKYLASRLCEAARASRAAEFGEHEKGGYVRGKSPLAQFFGYFFAAKKVTRVRNAAEKLE